MKELVDLSRMAEGIKASLVLQHESILNAQLNENKVEMQAAIGKAKKEEAWTAQQHLTQMQSFMDLEKECHTREIEHLKSIAVASQESSAQLECEAASSNAALIEVAKQEISSRDQAIILLKQELENTKLQLTKVSNQNETIKADAHRTSDSFREDHEDFRFKAQRTLEEYKEREEQCKLLREKEFREYSIKREK